MRLRLLAAVLLLVAPAPAEAAVWKQITGSEGSSSDQVGLVRTPDGVLHVAWSIRSGPNTDDLKHTAINANGTVGATSPIQTGWAEIGNPAIVYTGIGISVFFGGIRSTDPGETLDEMSTAGSVTGGVSWELQSTNVVPVGAQAYGSSVSAVMLNDGTFYQAWAGTLGTWVHSGLSAASPNHDYQAPFGNYGYDAALAASGTQAMLAWYSNAAGHLGVHAQAVGAGGAPVGSAALMPGTGNMNVGMLGRTPIVARPGGGFYVAYGTGNPSINRVKVWKVGAAGTTDIAKTVGNNTSAAIAAAPDGRLWVAWTTRVGFVYHVFARRSNKATTKWGAVVDVGRPGVVAMYHLDASATSKAVDLFVNATPNLSSNAVTYYKRAFPGLSLTSSRAKLPRGKSVSVTFAVRDAGDAVKGAKVKAGGKSGTTNAQGRVTLRITGSGTSLKATVSKSGYTGGTLGLKVR